MAFQAPPKNLRQLNRYITTHDSHGKAVLSESITNSAPVTEINNGAMHFSLMYTNARSPQLTDGADIDFYQSHLKTPPAITVPNGTVCRVCDYPPGCLTPMHRTLSLDYGVVLEGEIELVLDSGETQLLGRGDVVVQRGTNHAWRNVSPDYGWARMLYVLQASEAIRLASGEVLGGDEGGIDRGTES
ncbi:hypothetical protein LTR15_009146 [Elasticomyces elasticus]|nr:hypothetical protein LTR15_009146 [Elasticomyces elasticus]